MVIHQEGGLTLRPHHPKRTLLRSLVERFALRVEAGSMGGETWVSAEVTGATLDSRDVRPGDLYLALPGANRHGASFIDQAARRGAVAVLTDAAGAQMARESSSPLPVLICEGNPREIAGWVSAEVFGTGEVAAPVFGVTGTNGKTSVIYCLATLLEAMGRTVGLSTTAERRVGEAVLTSSLTSPEAPELHALLSLMLESGVDGIALEVSAHAVERHRIDGVHFDVVAFNNFSHDHLDDFGDLEQYFQAKLALFTPAHATRAVVVVDSVHGQRIARESQIPVTRLATEYGADADWHLAVTSQSMDGVSFVLQGPNGAHLRARVPLFGRFMAENAALALVMLHEAGVSLEVVASSLDHGLIPVYIPGRLERISPPERGPHVFVDYGHTPGSFQAMLDALGEVAPGRVIFLFGADGDRDTTKREEMGRIAGAGSDIVIVCDYHPRTEDPAAIRAQLLAGVRSAGRAAAYEVGDPRQAIRLAISLAEADDVILYAGPGHEEFQEIDGEQLPYSARDEVRVALHEAGVR